MPTTITHAVLAGVAAKTFREKEQPVALWSTAIVVSALADADVIGFSFGVRYGDFFGHRGFFHSPFFALMISILCVMTLFSLYRPFTRTWWKYVVFFFLVGASHGILDAFTDGGLGIALLSPFTARRYFFPWTPIPVAPIGFQAVFEGAFLPVMIWEIVYLWVPAFVLLSVFAVVRYRHRKKLEERDCAQARS